LFCLHRTGWIKNTTCSETARTSEIHR